MPKFLKPTLWKIILMFALLLIFSILWRALIVRLISDTFPVGFPFQFFLAWGPCPPGENCSELNGLFLVLDLIIWYFISALVVNLFATKK